MFQLSKHGRVAEFGPRRLQRFQRTGAAGRAARRPRDSRGGVRFLPPPPVPAATRSSDAQPPLRAPDAVQGHPPLALLHRGTHVLPRLAAAFELGEVPPRLPGAPDADQEQNDRGNDQGLHNSLPGDLLCGKGEGPRPDMDGAGTKRPAKYSARGANPNWGMLRGPWGIANGSSRETSASRAGSRRLTIAKTR